MWNYILIDVLLSLLVFNWVREAKLYFCSVPRRPRDDLPWIWLPDDFPEEVKLISRVFHILLLSFLLLLLLLLKLLLLLLILLILMLLLQLLLILLLLLLLLLLPLLLYQIRPLCGVTQHAALRHRHRSVHSRLWLLSSSLRRERVSDVGVDAGTEEVFLKQCLSDEKSSEMFLAIHSGLLKLV